MLKRKVVYLKCQECEDKAACKNGELEKKEKSSDKK